MDTKRGACWSALLGGSRWERACASAWHAGGGRGIICLDRLKELGRIIILSVDKKEQVKPKHLKGIRTTIVFDPDDFGGDDPGW